MFFFAESTTPPPGTESFLAIAFYLVGVVTAVVVLWKHLTGKSEQTTIAPQPLEVKAHTSFASRDELSTVKTEVHGRIKREREEIDRQIQRVADDAKERADHLDRKIDENTKLTAEMNGQVKQINQTTTQISSSLMQFLQNQANK